MSSQKGFFEERWSMRYKQLQSYYEKHGDCLVSCPKGGTLGRWVKTQRKEYKDWKSGRHSNMTHRRAQLLVRLNFDWSPMSSGATYQKKKTWHAMLNELIEYKKINGHCHVQKNHDQRLYNWVHDQRNELKAMKKKETTTMNNERKRKLDKISFDWTLKESTGCKLQSVWEGNMAEYRKYKQKYRRRPIPSTGEYKYLSSWAHRQRNEYRKRNRGEQSAMTEDRIQKLDE
eukprot:4354326-Ditylum_brightwellii.AAC.1